MFCFRFIFVELVFDLYFMRDWDLCRRLWLNQLHKLCQWNFVKRWCIKLYDQLHRMQRGHLLVLGLHTMHELWGRQIQCDYGGDELLFMLGRNLCFLDWIKCMQCLWCRVVLRNCGAIRRYRVMRRGQILECISDRLRKLSCRHVYCIDIFFEL